MDSHVAPLALPTHMGTTKEIDLMENTQFRGRNGIAQAYLLKLDSEEERSEWLKHSVVFLERPSDHHAQLFFDPLAPHYYAKTWSSLNFALANASFSAYPTATSVVQRWRYMGVTDNVQPLHGLFSHQGPACQAQINVVIGQYVRTFNYWLSGLDPEALQANKSGLHCWGVVKLDQIAPAVRTRPRTLRPLGSADEKDSDEVDEGSDEVAFDAALGGMDWTDSRTPMTQSRRTPSTPSTVASSIYGMGNPKPAEVYNFMGVKPQEWVYPYSGCYSGHQFVDARTLQVWSNHIIASKSLNAYDMYLDLYPVTVAQRDVVLALRHGWVAEEVNHVAPYTLVERLKASEAVETWFTDHRSKNQACAECNAFRQKTQTEPTLEALRLATSTGLMQRYTDDFFTAMQTRPAKDETWFLFPGGFAIKYIVPERQGAPVRFELVKPPNVEVPKTEFAQAEAWINVLEASHYTPAFGSDKHFRKTPEGATVLPAVLLAFWFPEPAPMGELPEYVLEVVVQKLQADSRGQPFYMPYVFPEVPPTPKNLDEEERFASASGLYHHLEESDPSSGMSSRPPAKPMSSAPLSSVTAEDLTSRVMAKRKQAGYHFEVPLVEPDWFHGGYRWQIVPVVTDSPVPPCESSLMTEPIYMGRCIFVMGSAEQDPGTCLRFVQPDDPRASVAKLASRVSQIDLVVCSHPS